MKRPYQITADELPTVPNRATVILSGVVADVGEIVIHRSRRVLSITLKDDSGEVEVFVGRRMQSAAAAVTG